MGSSYSLLHQVDVVRYVDQDSNLVQQIPVHIASGLVNDKPRPYWCSSTTSLFRMHIETRPSDGSRFLVGYTEDRGGLCLGLSDWRYASFADRDQLTWDYMHSRWLGSYA